MNLGALEIRPEQIQCVDIIRLEYSKAAAIKG